MPFPFIEASGTPLELGRSHGEQAKEQIHRFLETLIQKSGMPREDVLLATRRFRPYFEAHCPRLLEEVRGLAQGAGISPEEALLLQIRGEIQGALADRGCTTFAVDQTRSATGGILIGQTSDMAAEWEQFFLVARLHPDNGPSILMWTFAGQLGYHGLNEHGVAHFANSVSGGPSPAAFPDGLPHYPVKRRLYECRTRQEVLHLWGSLPVCSSGNYMVATGEPDIFDVEVTPTGFAVLEPTDGLLVHANHFRSSRYRTAATDAASLPDSFQRQSQMEALLRNAPQPITLCSLQEAVENHQGTPHSICRHEEIGDEGMVTVAALIAEPAAGLLHVARGNPCKRDWTSYQL